MKPSELFTEITKQTGLYNIQAVANVYFDPRNPMLFVRMNEIDNICIIKFDRSILDIDRVVVSDRNASSKYAGFYSPEVGLSKIDFDKVYASDWRDENLYAYYEKKSVKCAEVLIPYRIPPDYVSGVAVYNDAVKQKVLDTGFDRCIFVDKRLFF